MSTDASDDTIITNKCRGKSVLFLDIDGTLGPAGQHVYMDRFEPWRETAESLAKIIRHTDAMVVLCTTRVGQQPDLAEHVQRLVCPETPWRMAGQCCSPKRVMFTNGMTPKEAMVTRWLKTVGDKYIYPSRWAIFDDEPSPAPHWAVAGRWVKPRGPLREDSAEWWMLWSLLSGHPARRSDGRRWCDTVLSTAAAEDRLGYKTV